MASINLRFINQTADTHGIAIFQKNVRGSALFVLRNVAPNETRDFSYDLNPDDTTIHISTLRDLHDTALATELPIANRSAAEITMSGEDPWTFELAHEVSSKRIIAVVGATGAEVVAADVVDP